MSISAAIPVIDSFVSLSFSSCSVRWRQRSRSTCFSLARRRSAGGVSTIQAWSTSEYSRWSYLVLVFHCVRLLDSRLRVCWDWAILLIRMYCVVDCAMNDHLFNYRKRGSASYIVREVREVREREIQREREREREREKERERERERERDGSDVTIVALKLAISLHFPLPPKYALSFLPSHSLQEITGKSNGNRPPIENEWHILRVGTVLAIWFECKIRLASTFSQKPFFTDTGQTIATL